MQFVQSDNCISIIAILKLKTTAKVLNRLNTVNQMFNDVAQMSESNLQMKFQSLERKDFRSIK